MRTSAYSILLSLGVCHFQVIRGRKRPKFRFGSAGFGRFGSAKKSEVRFGSGSAKIPGSVVS